MADDGNTILVYYPPDSKCFMDAYANASHGYDEDTIKDFNCTVSQTMVTYLNLTEKITDYVAAYCTNPPKDDNCPFDFCPNPDIAGPLVRIANYITAFCLAILIFYSPRRVQEAFWSQVLTVYSLLITCLVAIARGDLTRFHALVVLSLIFSPITVYFIAYAVRSFWSGQHRLESVLGRTRYLRRSVILLAGSLWLGLFIFVYLPKGVDRFAQASCKNTSVIESFFLIVPLLFMGVGATAGLIYPVVLFTLIMLSMIVTWIVAIYLRRKEIWPPGEPYRPRFVKVWRTVGDNYPFIQFMTVVVYPMAYWICIVELSTYKTADNKFSLSFGQVFALFVAVPPAIQAMQLAVECWFWFRGLTWVQRIAGPPPKYHMKISKPPTGMPDLMPREKQSQREESYSDH